MRAEIISIGTELLLGHIVDTNAVFLSQRLAEIGVDVFYRTTIGDNPDRLHEAFTRAAARSDLVIASGGLGPTVDDVTIEVLARLTGRKLILNKIVLADLKKYFRLKHVDFVCESIRQAYIPEGIRWLRNRVGTAPGLVAKHHEATIICLPGPPRELEPMYLNSVVPILSKKTVGRWSIRSREIKIVGLPESAVNGLVKDLLRLPPPTTVGIYASLGQVTLRIMAKSKDAKSADRAMIKVQTKILSRLKDYIFGFDNDTLEGIVGNILAKNGLTVAVAESCTGGLLAHRLTDVSGSSRYFAAGFVTYANQSKIDQLGVSAASIDEHGAVSKQVAGEMAKKVRCIAKSDIGVGISGIAGPSGGRKGKPVGLVYIALAIPKRTTVKEFRFTGSRKEIKFQASQAALDLIRRNLSDHDSAIPQ